MQEISCYLCKSNEYMVIFPGSSSDIELSPEHIAARQGEINKEFSYTWVRCKKCDLVYANPVPDEMSLSKLYAASDQGSYLDETVNLANTYGRYLISHSNAIVQRGVALDVGAGTGFFLKILKSQGFNAVIGIEPSAAACASADPEIREHLRNTMFSEDDLAPESIDLISCFQTLEHVSQPDNLLASFSRLLTKGGIVYAVAHNFGSLGVKLLGAKHPIVNAGHLTLFDMQTIRKMFEQRFEVIDVFPISNTYSLEYWLTLLPVPKRVRQLLHKCASILHISRLPLTLSLGNMGIFARKK